MTNGYTRLHSSDLHDCFTTLYTTFDKTLNSVYSQLLVENLPHVIFHF